MRALPSLVVLVLVAAGCGGEAARPRPTSSAKTGAVPTVTSPEHQRGSERPLPRWQGPAPRPAGDEARGPRGRLRITHPGDGDRLWWDAPAGRTRLIAQGGGVMEGAIELRSPMWVGAKLVWAETIDRTGSDYDGWIVSWDARTGRKVRVAIPKAYVESLARAGGRLVVRYVTTDPTGQSIGPDPARTQMSAFALSRLG